MSSMKRFSAGLFVALAVAALGLPMLARAKEDPRPEPVTPSEGIPGCVPGRVVYYTPFESDGLVTTGEPIVGLIQRVFDKNTGMCNLRLLPDDIQSGSKVNYSGNVTSRTYDANGAPGTWRFCR